MMLTARVLIVFTLLSQLAACGGGGGTAGTTTTTPGSTTPTVAGVSLGTTLTTIKTDGSTTATITATVVDSSNRALIGIPVTFSTDTGLLVSPTSPTSATGEATVILKNGTANFSNRTATVTATAGGKTSTIAITLSGSTLTPSGLSVGTSRVTIPTDGSASATVTATVVDASLNALAGVAVTFTTTNGVLSNVSSPTNSSGEATVVLRNGTADFSNRTATVTATAGTKSAAIPIIMNGSTLTLTSSATTTATQDITFTATALNSAPASTGVLSQTIRFSKGAGSTGDGTFSASTGITGPTGIAPTVGGAVVPIRLTPTAPGTVIVVAEWLDANGAVSTTATQTITVTAPGIAFVVTNPAVSPSSLALGTQQAFAVSVPATINGVAVADVRFSASSGQWSSGTSVSTKVPASNAVAETYTPSLFAGTVTVTIEARSATSVTLGTITRTIAVSAPASTAANLSLQAAASTVPPSSGANLSTTTLTATVRNAANAAVGGAPVLFELLNTTGTGESISPAVAYTDGTGVATATFTAGSLATNGSIYVRASVVGAAACTTSPPTLDPVATCKSVSLLVNAGAVSVTIGLATVITDAGNGTLYKYPGSVLVVDNNGSPVAGKVVTLSLFPLEFRRGSVSAVTGCAPTYTTVPLLSEDLNRNGILDAGEDSSGNGGLTPATADGGAVPSSVTTDATGVATFEITYPKTSAMFIRDELTARITVTGTERAAQSTFVLPVSAADATATVCPLAGTRSFP